MANRNFIGFRLRKEFDQDLVEALSNRNNNEISELCRTSLRLALGIASQRVVEVKEIPVTAPAVWRPKQK